MELGKQNSIGLILEIADSFVDCGVGGDPVDVVVSLDYSGGEDDVVEFEGAAVREELNPGLEVETISEINQILESWKEEEYVRVLEKFYAGTSIVFDTNIYPPAEYYVE